MNLGLAPRAEVIGLKLFGTFLASVLLTVGAAAQSTPIGAKVGVPSQTATPDSKEQARQKFVLDVVHSAVSLPLSDPQDRLRVLSEAVNVVGPIDQKLAQQFAREGTSLETKLVAEGQKPSESMLASGHVDCASAASFVQALPPGAVVDAEQALIGAMTTCPKQVNEAVKSKLEGGVAQGAVAGRAIVALMDSEGMSSPWSQAMFVKMYASLPGNAPAFAPEAPNYAAMFGRVSAEMSNDKDAVKTAGSKLLLWLAKLPESPQRSVAVNLTTGALSEALGAAAYQELLRSDVALQQIAASATADAELPPPDEENVSVLRAMSNTGDRTDSLQAMTPSMRAREAAASGFASGTSGDRKLADRYFDIAFASADEVWANRAGSKTDAPEVIQEVSEAAAQVDPIAALQRSQRLQDPSAEAISMLAVARVVAGQP
jgi:hypothetical protein